MADLDPRLGKIDGETVVYPLKTLGGNPYRVALTTRGIGDGYFVVLDPFPTDAMEDEIAALRAILMPKPTADTPKRPPMNPQEIVDTALQRKRDDDNRKDTGE